MDTPLKSSKSYWCVAEGCNSDDRKRGKYGYMADVEFFPFPTAGNREKSTKDQKEMAGLCKTAGLCSKKIA